MFDTLHPAVVSAIVVVVFLAVALGIWVFLRSSKGSADVEAPEKPQQSAELPPPEDETSEGGDDSVLVEQGGVTVEDEPEAAETRMQRLRGRLARGGALGGALLSLLSRGDLSEADWEEIEDTLLLADVGIPATEAIIEKLRTEVKVRGKVTADEAKQILRAQLLEAVDPNLDRTLKLDGNPSEILVVGVNGTGKTTTVGKLARLLRAEEKTVLLGAADTFRAAAAEQLSTWGERVGVPVVSADKEGGDPASVAFDAVKAGIEQGVDVVMVDTAGRLQTKSALMDELGKVKRVMEKHGPVDEVLLVLDATTGQNGMRQAEVFGEVVGLTGIVLTKLDGSAKGGIVISVQKELGVPVKFVGLGEGPDDLAPFDPEGFVDAIVG